MTGLRFVLFVGVLGALAAFPSAASAQTVRQDSVQLENGSQDWTADPYFSLIRINATSGPNGENPTGRVTYTISQLLIFDGPVTCLAVRGDTATINFRNTSFLGDPPRIFTVQVSDGQPDSFDAAFIERAPTDCSPLPRTGDWAPLVRMSGDSGPFGDLRIVDAKRRFRLEDLCRNGGWRKFRFFRNEHHCVGVARFVERLLARRHRW